MSFLASTPAPTSDDDVDPLLGRVLDERYAVDSLLGEGGLGRVYRGRHLKLDRPVAIKILLEEHRDMDTLRQRFEREARTLSTLSHPNIVTITDFGVDRVDDAEVPYLVMELVEGRDLESLLTEQGRFAPKRAFDIMRQLLKSLAYAHAQGVVHRDLKPGNILLRPLPDGSEHVEVLDFGLAKFFEEGGEAAQAGSKLTRIGTIVGTPAYMAPEQVEGSRCDARTDVYAATLVLFEMLTGQMAFDSDETTVLLRHHLISPPPTLQSTMPGAYADQALENLIQKGLAKRPHDRFASGSEMLDALEAIDDRDAFRPTSLPPPSRGETRPTAVAQPALADSTAPRLSLDDALAKIPEPVKEAFGRARRSMIAQRVLALPRWVLAAVGLAGVLVFAAVLAIFASAVDAPPPPPLPLPEADTTIAFLEDKPDARDPFSDDTLPAELRPLHEKLSQGRRLSRREIGTLRTFQRDYPNDPRPFLLHAHAYTAKGWLSMALPIYLQAYRMDPSVRGDPLMLDAIIRMARSRKLAVEGANAVQAIYGDEAEDALEVAITEANRPDDRRRLEALLEAID